MVRLIVVIVIVIVVVSCILCVSLNAENCNFLAISRPLMKNVVKATKK